MTINVFDAVRKATDPMGIDGEQVSAIPPSAKEVLARLGTLGFVVVAPLDIGNLPGQIIDGEVWVRASDVRARAPAGSHPDPERRRREIAKPSSWTL